MTNSRLFPLALLFALASCEPTEGSFEGGSVAPARSQPGVEDAFSELAGFYVGGPSCDAENASTYILEPAVIRTETSLCVLDTFTREGDKFDLTGACVFEGLSERRKFSLTALDAGILLLVEPEGDTLLRPCI